MVNSIRNFYPAAYLTVARHLSPHPLHSRFVDGLIIGGILSVSFIVSFLAGDALHRIPQGRRPCRSDSR